jgi:hypothetical protein
MDSKHIKKYNTCGREGENTLILFRNILNMKTPIAVVQKAQQFPRISTHLMMAELAETYSAVTNFKRI